MIPGGRALHIDCPAGPAPGWRGRADLDQSWPRPGWRRISAGDAARLLLKILATPGLPDRVAIHGRIGVPGPAHAGPAAPARCRPAGSCAR